MKKIMLIAGALTSFVLAFLSYQYLPFQMFFFGMSRFYDIAPTIPEECLDTAGYAAAGFAGVYDYVALGVTLAFVVLGVCITSVAVFIHRRETGGGTFFKNPGQD